MESQEIQEYRRPKREIISKLNHLTAEDIEEEKPIKTKIKKFNCSKCKTNKSFLTQKQLDRHIQSAHKKKEDKKITCDICSKNLKSEIYLKRHKATRHRETPRVFICDYDGKSFTAKDYIRIHMDRHRLHQILSCSVCQRRYISKHTFRRHLKSHIEKHSCLICGMTFGQKTLLDNHHVSKHTFDYNYSCDFCTRKFPSKTARNNHHYTAHKDKTSQLSFQCKECKIYFEMKEELRIHSFIHFNGEIRTCLDCGQIFKTNRLLKIHMQKHETNKSFQCNSCGDLFTFKTGLAKHVRLNRCKGPIINDDEANAEEMEEEVAVELARKQLSEISKRLGQKTVLNVEKEEETLEEQNENVEPANESESETENNIEEVFNSLEFKNKSLSRTEETKVETKETRKSRKKKINHPIKSRQGRPHLIYICDFCGEKVKFKKEILNHMRHHTSEKKYKCKECSTSFKSRKKLIEHSNEVHGIKLLTVSEAFSCEVCDKKFDLKSIYEAHKLSHDDTARPYICLMCSAAFKSIGNLNRHEATHITARNFECNREHCNKRFKTKLALKIHNETVHPEVKVFVKCHICDTLIQEKYFKVHMRNQHTEEGKEKPFCCTICNKTFKTEKLGQRHYEAVHDPKSHGIIYSCPQCPELQFYRQRDLKQHSFMHFEGIIFHCEICSKMFKNKRLLSIHNAVHNVDAGNFECKHCNVIFKTRGGRRKHVMRVHVKDEEKTAIKL